MPMQKDQNPSARGTSVLLPAAEQEGGRFVQQVCVTPLTLRVLGCPVLPGVSVFGSFVETSVLSAHQFEAAFPLPASVENTIKEKNQCILKH